MLRAMRFLTAGLILLLNLLCLQSAPTDLVWTCAYMIEQTRSYINRMNVRGFQQNVYCDLCDGFLPLIKLLLAKNKPQAVDHVVGTACSTVLRTLIPRNVCIESYKTYRADVFKILQTTSLSSKEICRNVFACSKVPFIEWNVSIPTEGYQPFAKLNQSGSLDGHPWRILHLTDIHLQPDYQPNSNAACNEPLCCHGPEIADVSKRAGLFGDYRRCDLPIWTIEKIFSYINNHEKFDFIYWTGDASAHQMWRQSTDTIIKINQAILVLFSQHFPGKKVYSSIGNHDIHPCNMFPPSSASNSSGVLYNSVVDQWMSLASLPSECRKTITRGGFYTTLIGRKLRLVSLNTNYGRRENFWLQVNQTDPEDQLAWLVETLNNAERRGEKVHIIAHHFPATSMWSWSANYANIVKRYNRTISGQLFGHDHADMFTVFTDDGRNAFSTAYISPSLTTFPNQNPAYTIYTVDSSTGEVLDHDTTIMDLTKSNEQQELVMQHEYSMKEMFNLRDLSPQSMLELVIKAKDDLYGDIMNKLLSVRYKISGVLRCDTKCRNSVICSMLNYRSDSEAPCKYVAPIAYIFQQVPGAF